MQKARFKWILIVICAFILSVTIFLNVSYYISNPVLDLNERFIGEIKDIKTTNLGRETIIYWKLSNKMCGIGIYKQGLNGKYKFIKIDVSESSNNQNLLFTAILEGKKQTYYIIYGEVDESVEKVIISNELVHEVSEEGPYILYVEAGRQPEAEVILLDKAGQEILVDKNNKVRKKVIQAE